MDDLDWSSLQPDVASKILTCLDDPGDIVRASSLSRAWLDSVIENGICKLLCLRLFPQLSGIAHIVDLNTTRQQNCSEAGCSRSDGLEQLKKEHRVFSSLAQRLSSSEVGECIAGALLATSTDNYPEESVSNTLEPWDQIGYGASSSYWSSSGTYDPEVPEMLTYELISDFCVITEINVQPFQAFFEASSPIYSAKAVRFRTGYRFYDLEDDGFWPCSDKHFCWTYTSEEFPMAQENRLQNFKLPNPVLCIGGLVQIELLGRVQRQERNDKFYICLTHVQVLGRSLASVFDVDTLEPTGRFCLLFDPHGEPPSPPSTREEPNELNKTSEVVQSRVIDYLEWE
ncbi:hypothetical protein vseg_009308 [Gypsophila vaccaria]